MPSVDVQTINLNAPTQTSRNQRLIVYLMWYTVTVPNNRYSGSSFDSFLDGEGIREEVEAVAIKRVLAWQLEQEMKKQKKTKQQMASELQTSRSQLDRLLDPRNMAVSLETITRAARALGKTVVLRIASPRVSRRGA